MSETPIKVLMVEDNHVDARLVEVFLTRASTAKSGYVFDLTHLQRLDIALDVVAVKPFDIILLDLSLPDSQGLDTLKQTLRTFPELPIIVLSATNEEALALEAIQAGAQDYLVKGYFDPDLLVRTIRYAIQRKQSELALHQGEQEFRALVENSPDAIMLTDLGANLLFCNRQAAILHRYKTTAEMLGKNVLEFIAPEDHERAMQNAQRAVEQGQVKNIEYTLLKKTGTRFPAESSISLLIDIAKKPQGFIIITRDITQAKRTDIRLRLLGSAVQQATEAILIMTAELDSPGPQIVFANPAFTQITGYEVEEVIGQTLRILQGPDTEPDLLDHFRDNLSQGKPVQSETVNYRKDGTEFHLEWHITPLRSESGVITNFIAIQRDISERKQAEAEMLHRNRELALLNQIIAVSVTELEPTIILETACRELGRLFNISRVTTSLLNEAKTEARVVAEYIGEGRFEILNSIEAVADDPVWQHLLSKVSPLIVTDAPNDPRQIRYQDGNRQRGIAARVVVPLIIKREVVGSLGLESIRPRLFSAHEIGLTWSVADQVAAALARVRLAQTHERLSTVVEQSAESVVMTDTEGIISYVNPAFERTSGYSRGEVIGQSPRFLKSGDHEAAFYENLWATITAGLVWYGRMISQKKDGTRYTEDVTISPIRDESGIIVNFVAVKHDITHELKLEAQYLQAQKMEAVGRLTGGIAHDFNNLLTVINGFAEILQMRLPSDHPQQKEASDILQSGRRAVELIRQLMTFSRRQIIQPIILDLNKVLAELEKMLRRIIGEDIELKIMLDPELWSIKMDPAQIEQVIVNLVVNARDAMPEGGSLTFETANVVIVDEHTNRHLELEPGEYVLLSVSDNGVGMNEAVQAHIFEPFFTTKDKNEGTGLGLATVFGIVKQSGGSIWIYSQEGQGSTFKIYLPRANIAASASTAETSLQMPSGSETILLVEDNEDVLRVARPLLEGQGYIVLEATNGQQALQLCAQHSEPIHLLLTDVVLPGISGRALSEKLIQTHPNLKVLFMSGYTNEAIAHHGVLEPGALLLQKPFSAMDLASKVRLALDQPIIHR